MSVWTFNIAPFRSTTLLHPGNHITIETRSFYVVPLTRTRVFRSLFSRSIAEGEDFLKDGTWVSSNNLLAISGYIFCYLYNILSLGWAPGQHHLFSYSCTNQNLLQLLQKVLTLLRQFIALLDTLPVHFLFTIKIILKEKKKFPKQSISVIDISGLMVF